MFKKHSAEFLLGHFKERGCKVLKRTLKKRDFLTCCLYSLHSRLYNIYNCPRFNSFKQCLYQLGPGFNRAQEFVGFKNFLDLFWGCSMMRALLNALVVCSVSPFTCYRALSIPLAVLLNGRNENTEIYRRAIFFFLPFQVY